MIIDVLLLGVVFMQVMTYIGSVPPFVTRPADVRTDSAKVTSCTPSWLYCGLL
jgi:hypothetical protein